MRRTEFVDKIASKLHEQWRARCVHPQRWKPIEGGPEIKDKCQGATQKYIEGLDMDNLPPYIRVNENGSLEIDIKNCEYENLSPAWQYENHAAAEVVADILIAEQNGRNFTLDEVGSIIHDKWLERHGEEEWVKGGELDKPFSELSTYAQNEDLDQYKVGLEVLGNEKILPDETVKTIANPDGEGK